MPNLNQHDGQRLRRAPFHNTASYHSRLRWWTVPAAGAAIFVLATSLSPKMLLAQAADSQAAHPTAQEPAVHSSTAHPHSTAHHSARKQAKKPAAGTPAPPPPPPRPNWPAEQPPTPAKVTWDSKGLAIQASNSSLQQILNEVTADTGVKLQGLSQDERVFGNFGPGPAREILSQLLDGSGYNMLMIGGSGDEPPRQIILTRSTPGAPQPARVQNNNNGDDEPDATQTYSEPSQPLPQRSPFGPGGPPRTPQQIQQELLMRQQQMQNQVQQPQQQQPQQQQPNNPRF